MVGIPSIFLVIGIIAIKETVVLGYPKSINTSTGHSLQLEDVEKCWLRTEIFTVDKSGHELLRNSSFSIYNHLPNMFKNKIQMAKMIDNNSAILPPIINVTTLGKGLKEKKVYDLFCEVKDRNNASFEKDMVIPHSLKHIETLNQNVVKLANETDSSDLIKHIEQFSKILQNVHDYLDYAKKRNNCKNSNSTKINPENSTAENENIFNSMSRNFVQDTNTSDQTNTTLPATDDYDSTTITKNIDYTTESADLVTWTDVETVIDDETVPDEISTTQSTVESTNIELAFRDASMIDVERATELSIEETRTNTEKSITRDTPTMGVDETTINTLNSTPVTNDLKKDTTSGLASEENNNDEKLEVIPSKNDLAISVKDNLQKRKELLYKKINKIIKQAVQEKVKEEKKKENTFLNKLEILLPYRELKTGLINISTVDKEPAANKTLLEKLKDKLWNNAPSIRMMQFDYDFAESKPSDTLEKDHDLYVKDFEDQNLEVDVSYPSISNLDYIDSKDSSLGDEDKPNYLLEIFERSLNRLQENESLTELSSEISKNLQNSSKIVHYFSSDGKRICFEIKNDLLIHKTNCSKQNTGNSQTYLYTSSSSGKVICLNISEESEIYQTKCPSDVSGLSILVNSATLEQWCKTAKNLN